MEHNAFSVSLAKNPLISIKVIPGHFSTNNAHSNHYLDLSGLKSNALIARDVALELAIPYRAGKLVDTIVCMEKTEVIGAYLAQELLQSGQSVINAGNDIRVVAPMVNVNGNLVFSDSMVEYISNRHILLLVTTVSSGRTVNVALECLAYYGGLLSGISTLFLASPQKTEQEINTLFTYEDVEGYKLFSPSNCDLCKAGQKLDAIVTSEGYTKIRGM